MAADIDAAEAAQLQAVMGVLSTACPSTDDLSAQQHSSIDKVQGTNDTTDTEITSTSRMEVDVSEEAHAPSVTQLTTSGTTEAAAAAAVAAQPVPADPDEDIFGATAQDTVATAQGSQSAQDPGAASASQSQTGSDSSHQATQSQNMQRAAQSNETQSQDMGQGFLFDESSGTWYNADLGYYYDASQGLYGDASSGHWYMYRDGTYEQFC